MSNTVGVQVVAWLRDRCFVHPLVGPAQLEETERAIDRIFAERLRVLETAILHRHNDLRLACEFGFRQCEKGHNLSKALIEFERVRK